MDIFIRDGRLNTLGIVEDFAELLWVRRYYSAGGFELTAPATEKNVGLLKKHRLLERPECDEVGVIMGIMLSSNARDGNVIKATGSFMSGVMDFRKIIDANAGDDLLTVIDKQMGTSAAQNRRFPIEIDRSVLVPSEFIESQRFLSLAAYAEDVCRMELCGLTVKIKRAGQNRLVLGARYGVDRSAEQSAVPRVIFSLERENLLSCEYVYSEEGAVSTVYGYTKAINNDSQVIPPREYVFGDDKNGFERREASVEVQAVTEEYTERVVVGQQVGGGLTFKNITLQRVNEVETLKLLQDESEKTLRGVDENMTGRVDFNRGYRTKYDLGDVVSIYNKKWDVFKHERILEAREHYGRGTVTIEPVFGSPLKTIMEFMK